MNHIVFIQHSATGSLARGVAKAEEVMNQCAVAIAQAEADAMKIATSVELEIMQAQQEADIKVSSGTLRAMPRSQISPNNTNASFAGDRKRESAGAGAEAHAI